MLKLFRVQIIFDNGMIYKNLKKSYMEKTKFIKKLN